jgi:hypothetical protein
MAVGMVTGAAMASAASSANSANSYNAGYVAGSSSTGSTNAYNAGYVAGSTNAAAYTGGNAPIGAIYATLPSSCMVPGGLGSTYYLCGSTWFKPSYGANGVYYRVVPAP